MLSAVARFEAGYQLRNPVLWVSFGILFLLTFAATTIDQVSIGDTSNVKLNSPFVIVQTTLIMGIFALFAVAAFVANSVTRDDETGFGPILRATPLKKGDYLFGRFAGAYVAAAIGLMSVPFAVFVGSLMPWVDQEKIGPNIFVNYAYAYGLIALPMLFVFGSVLFALATATRSMIGAYLGLIGILIGWIVTGNLLNRPELETIAALADPTGASALFRETRYWTAAERNTQLPEITGLFLQNRAIWFGVALAFLGLAYLIFRPVTKGAALRTGKPVGEKKRATALEARATRKYVPQSDSATAWKQFRARMFFDMRAVLGSPGFVVLMMLGLLNAGGSLWFANEFGETTNLPVTRVMVGALQSAFSIIPIIIAAYYAGDLVWRDRERRMHEIIDATPVSDWAFVAPKVFAIFLVLVVIALVGAGAGALTQSLKDYTNFEWMGYLLWWVVPVSLASAQLAVLAIFFQAISPNKYVGWGFILIYLIASITLGTLGYQHNLYNFGGNPGVPLSDFNGMAHFWIGRLWFDLYWSAFCVILAILAYGLWRRGAEMRLTPRLARLPYRMADGTGAALMAAVVAMAGLGGWIYYNTNILNDYISSVDAEEQLANAEKALGKYETLPGPTIVSVALDVDLRPRERMATTRGMYVIENKTGAPLKQALLQWPDLDGMVSVDFPGARVSEEWRDYNVQMWTFDAPMKPGEKKTVSFVTTFGRPGFTNGTGQVRVVENGTFVNNFELTPGFGVTQSQWLRDPGARRKYGLDPNQRPAKLEDQAATKSHYLRKDSDWVDADITVTTDGDQIPIAPGYQVSETKANGRITRRFKTEAPIQHFFSIQSARYKVHTSEVKLPAGPVRLEIYHLAQHDTNIDRMERAMKASLEIFSERFSPFQFKQMRILEFPAYANFAQAFANTVPFSENLGWLQANKDPSKVDLVTFVTAHEIAHQWWAHQVIGADKQGMTMLSESFAQYSALLVMEKLFGPEQVRQFLKRELDQYLRARGGEAVEELPLVRVENQGYIHYNKGALIMYFLRNEVGEEPVNKALRRLIAQYAFKAAPYPSSSEFVAFLREEVGPQHQQLITDLFERITIYDAKVTAATRKKLPGGGWEIELKAGFTKFDVDGKGAQKELDFAEEYEVGIFTKRPSDPEFRAKHVLSMQRVKIKNGEQSIKIVLPKGTGEPMVAGVDPYVKRIDRNTDDNLADIAAK
jgi:ABC-2 type transport system permease protein